MLGRRSCLANPCRGNAVSSSRVFVALVTSSLIPAAAAAQAMFRGGPEHRGVYESPNPSVTTVAWRFKTNGRVISSPLVVNDVIYVGTTERNLYAVERSSGVVRWRFATKGWITSSPAFADGVGYIGSWDRNMYALDAVSGAERWRCQTGNDTVIYKQVGIASSAAVANRVVYFGCLDGHFYAVDAQSGTQRWVVVNKGG